MNNYGKWNKMGNHKIKMNIGIYDEEDNSATLIAA
jgi:hypothetical protein